MITSHDELPVRLAPGERGFTFLEVVVAGALLAVSLLALCGVFVVAYANLTAGGRNTVGVAAGQQMLEDVRGLPFDDVTALDDFDTDNPATQPAADPARDIARRWRYTLAGDGVGWTFSTAEKARWTNLSGASGPVGAAGTINVSTLSATLCEVTITVAVPGRWRPILLATRVARP